MTLGYQGHVSCSFLSFLLYSEIVILKSCQGSARSAGIGGDLPEVVLLAFLSYPGKKRVLEASLRLVQVEGKTKSLCFFLSSENT